MESKNGPTNRSNQYLVDESEDDESEDLKMSGTGEEKVIVISDSDSDSDKQPVSKKSKLAPNPKPTKKSTNKRRARNPWSEPIAISWFTVSTSPETGKSVYTCSLCNKVLTHITSCALHMGETHVGIAEQYFSNVSMKLQPTNTGQSKINSFFSRSSSAPSSKKQVREIMSKINLAVVQMVVLNNRPMNIVKDSGLGALCVMAGGKPPDVSSVRREVSATYAKVLKKLKDTLEHEILDVNKAQQLIAGIPMTNVVLESDGWRSGEHTNICTLFAHYIYLEKQKKQEDVISYRFQRRTFLLQLMYLPEGQANDKLADKIDDVTKGFNLRDVCSHLTGDHEPLQVHTAEVLKVDSNLCDAHQAATMLRHACNDPTNEEIGTLLSIGGSIIRTVNQSSKLQSKFSSTMLDQMKAAKEDACSMEVSKLLLDGDQSSIDELNAKVESDYVETTRFPLLRSRQATRWLSVVKMLELLLNAQLTLEALGDQVSQKKKKKKKVAGADGAAQQAGDQAPVVDPPNVAPVRLIYRYSDKQWDLLADMVFVLKHVRECVRKLQTSVEHNQALYNWLTLETKLREFRANFLAVRAKPKQVIILFIEKLLVGALEAAHKKIPDVTFETPWLEMFSVETIIPFFFSPMYPRALRCIGMETQLRPMVRSYLLDFYLRRKSEEQLPSASVNDEFGFKAEMGLNDGEETAGELLEEDLHVFGNFSFTYSNNLFLSIELSAKINEECNSIEQITVAKLAHLNWEEETLLMWSQIFTTMPKLRFLARIVMRSMTLPVSSCCSERFFSFLTALLSRLRSRLTELTVQQICFLRANWTRLDDKFFAHVDKMISDSKSRVRVRQIGLKERALKLEKADLEKNYRDVIAHGRLLEIAKQQAHLKKCKQLELKHLDDYSFDNGLDDVMHVDENEEDLKLALEEAELLEEAIMPYKSRSGRVVKPKVLESV